jgi:hypothetical protein
VNSFWLDHNGLAFGHAVKPCAFSAPLRGSGA